MYDESSTEPPWIQTMGGPAALPRSSQCRRTPLGRSCSGRTRAQTVFRRSKRRANTDIEYVQIQYTTAMKR
jgi:hypothetical protein